MHVGCVSISESEASKGGPCLELGPVDNFLVPVKGWHLVDKGNQSGEGCIGSLSDVQVMDHLVGRTSGAMFSVTMMGSA